KRDADDRVCAEAGLALGPVELDQRPIQRTLIGGVEARDRGGDLAVDVRDRARHAPALPALAAVAPRLGLGLSRRRARGDRGVTVGAGAQPDLDLDRRVAPAVEDLARVNPFDLAHASASGASAGDGWLRASGQSAAVRGGAGITARELFGRRFWSG